jgi:outer membrane protein OmpA-like peptidoglycan-associated protein
MENLMPDPRALALPLALVALVADSPPASAQQGGDIELQAFQPSLDSRGLVTLNGSSVLGPGELSLGLVTSWGRGLLRLEDGEAHYVVDNMISPTLIAAVGLPLGALSAQLGASLPFHIMQGDRGPDSDGGTPGEPNDDSRFGFSGQGLGSAGVHAKVRPWQAVDIALIGSLFFPTASEEGSWLGATGIRPQLSAAADHRLGRVRLTANAGYRHQPGGALRFRDDDAPAGAPETMGEVSAGSSIPFGAGVALALVPERIEAIAEVFGAAPLESGAMFPLEALLGTRVYLATSSYLTIGGGSGLFRGSAANPDLRAFIGIVFEPRPSDRDGGRIRDRDCPEDPEGCVVAERDDPSDDGGDGLLDDDEECPDQPTPEDAYRCPDLDTDGDKIPDVDDLCPFEPGPAENAGCPERRRVIDHGGVLELLEKIHFEFDSAVIREESHPILDVLAETLRSSPGIVRLEVQGHTDERGSDAYNLDLSQRRADAVVDYLVGKKVARSRLIARGYGEREPQDPASNERAWYRNRRVEFIILDRTDDR